MNGHEGGLYQYEKLEQNTIKSLKSVSDPSDFSKLSKAVGVFAGLTLFPRPYVWHPCL